MNLPAEKQALLDTLIPGLAAVPGVEALALGGSYARGTAHPGSDLDIALYYREDAPLDVEAVRRIAAEISIQGEPVVTDLYGWGPWVNGGAWIYTAAGKVDFLYRSLDQVQRTIDAARQGKSEHDFGSSPCSASTRSLTARRWSAARCTTRPVTWSGSSGRCRSIPRR